MEPITTQSSMAWLAKMLNDAQAALSPQDYHDFLERASQEIQGRLNDPEVVSKARGIEPPRQGKVAGAHTKGSGV